MTRLGFRALVVVLLAVALGGAVLVLPSPGELGVRDEVDCRSFLSRGPIREMSSVRLLGCELDVGAEHMVLSSQGTRGPSVRPEVLPPAARELRERVMQASPGSARERYRARHADELRVVVDLEGQIAERELEWAVFEHSITPSRREPIHRAFGLSLLLFSLSLLWLTVRLDRRWRSRSEDLASGSAKPKSF